MIILFFLFQFSVPLFLKSFFNRASVPFYAQFLSFFQDLFVISLLCLLLPISVPFCLFLCFLLHVYLVLDFFVYNEMKLRVRWTDFFYLRDRKFLIHSAKEMGIKQFFRVILILLLFDGFGYFLYKDIQIDFIWSISIVTGLLSGISSLCIPRSVQYVVNHPCFLIRPTVREKKSLLPRFPPKVLANNPKSFHIQMAPEEKPHLVFLFLESFPAKYVGTGVTPCLDRWIQKGIYFSQFYSNGTLTYRALLSGLFGTVARNTARGLAPYVDVPFKGIPEFLKKKGYRTAFHHNGSLSFDCQDRFLAKHFDEMADQHSMNLPCFDYIGWGPPDEYLMEYSASWLEKQKNPTFLTLFTISNHHPWAVPSHYQSFQDSRFLQTLEYTDYSLGCFIEHLRAKNLSKKTLLFILGDHGQPTGEHHRNFYNSRFLYEENVHIPLLILGEGRISEPKLIDSIGSQMDLFPTVVDLFNENEFCLGSSLIRSDSERSVFLQNPYSEGFLGCRKGKWKWIENCFSSDQELYDLKEDPGETKNLKSVYPEIAELLKKQTHSFFSQIEGNYDVDFQEKPSSYCLDLSNSLVTDQQLQALILPQFNRVNLENCLLLTDRGISCLLARCPNLEKLNLKGILEVTEKAFEGFYPKLRTLDLSDAVDVKAEKLVSYCPYVQDLSFNIKSNIFLQMQNLVRLKLLNADEMTDDAMIFLLQRNPYLNSLMIYGCAKITDQILFFLKNLSLEILWFFDAPLFTDKGISYLEQLPLRSFALTGSPLVTEKSFFLFKKLESLYLKDCGTCSSNPYLLKNTVDSEQ